MSSSNFIKILLSIIFLIAIFSIKIKAQTNYIDSLNQKIATSENENEILDIKLKIAQYYLYDSTEYSDKIIDSIISEGKRIKYLEAVVLALNIKGEASYYLGNYSEELGYYIEAKAISEEINYTQGLIYSLKNIGVYNIFEDNYF